MIIVIPSIRSINIEYLAPLLGSGNRFIVIDDSEGVISIDHPEFEVFNWNDRRRMLGDFDRWFPRKNGVCRDFGFYIAWRDADDDEIIVALDDDCEVIDAGFGARVEAALSPGPRPLLQTAGRHANILECYRDVPTDLFPRGFPYEARADHSPWTLAGVVEAAPSFNLGLWSDAFDVNAIDKLQGPPWRFLDAQLLYEQVALPRGALISVCSMNMQFRRRLAPAAYQWPMHIPVMPGWVIDRYGDIWGGFALKLLMDVNEDCMTMGGPMIGHRKAGDMNRNIWQEHIAHFINAEMIELMCASATEVRAGSYLDGMRDLVEGISRRRDTASTMARVYLDHFVPAAKAWLTALTGASASTGGVRAYVT